MEITEYTAFSSYYLWFLVDRCHFVIDGVKSLQIYSKHTAFNNFVTSFMNERIEAMKEHNKGKEMFCKTHNYILTLSIHENLGKIYIY